MARARGRAPPPRPPPPPPPHTHTHTPQTPPPTHTHPHSLGQPAAAVHSSKIDAHGLLCARVGHLQHPVRERGGAEAAGCTSPWHCETDKLEFCWEASSWGHGLAAAERGRQQARRSSAPYPQNKPPRGAHQFAGLSCWRIGRTPSMPCSRRETGRASWAAAASCRTTCGWPRWSNPFSPRAKAGPLLRQRARARARARARGKQQRGLKPCLEVVYQALAAVAHGPKVDDGAAWGREGGGGARGSRDRRQASRRAVQGRLLRMRAAEHGNLPTASPPSASPGFSSSNSSNACKRGGGGRGAEAGGTRCVEQAG